MHGHSRALNTSLSVTNFRINRDAVKHNQPPGIKILSGCMPFNQKHNYCMSGSDFRITPLYEVSRPSFLPARRPPFTLAQAAEHLRREEHCLKERACGEAACERAEEAGRGGRVVEPPKLLKSPRAGGVGGGGRHQVEESE